MDASMRSKKEILIDLAKTYRDFQESESRADEWSRKYKTHVNQFKSNSLEVDRLIEELKSADNEEKTKNQEQNEESRGVRGIIQNIIDAYRRTYDAEIIMNESKEEAKKSISEYNELTKKINEIVEELKNCEE
jgi:methyl-accepting chemotaxis protein